MNTPHDYNEILRKIQTSVEGLEANWDKDREDFRQFIDALTHHSAEIKLFREAISKLPKQTRDRLAEVATPIITEAQNLTDQIENKKIIVVREKVSSFKFWKFWHKKSVKS